MASNSTADYFVRSHLVAKDQASYDKALTDLTTLAKEASSSSSVKSFAICVVNADQHGVLPSNDDPLTILVVQRSSTNPPPAPSLDASLFKAQTTTTSQASINATRPIDIPDTAHIITASFLYQIGKATDALIGWEEFVRFVGDSEEETYNYAVFQSLDTLSTFEVYSSPEYVSSVHLKSPAIAKNGEQNGVWRVRQGIYATRWHLKGGFLYRK